PYANETGDTNATKPATDVSTVFGAAHMARMESRRYFRANRKEILGSSAAFRSIKPIAFVQPKRGTSRRAEIPANSCNANEYVSASGGDVGTAAIVAGGLRGDAGITGAFSAMRITADCY
ncbi:hypothetical protein HK100_002884, partial [Physocladia obscura]